MFVEMILRMTPCSIFFFRAGSNSLGKSIDSTLTSPGLMYATPRLLAMICLREIGNGRERQAVQSSLPADMRQKEMSQLTLCSLNLGIDRRLHLRSIAPQVIEGAATEIP